MSCALFCGTKLAAVYIPQQHITHASLTVTATPYNKLAPPSVIYDALCRLAFRSFDKNTFQFSLRANT